MQEAASESIILIFVPFFFSCNLSKCFDLFMKNDCLPRACKIQGNVNVFLTYFLASLSGHYFNDNNNATIDRYVTQLWDIFQRNSINNQPPTLRKLLFIVKVSKYMIQLHVCTVQYLCKH